MIQVEYINPKAKLQGDDAFEFDIETVIDALEWYKLIIRAADEGRLDKVVEVLRG